MRSPTSYRTRPAAVAALVLLAASASGAIQAGTAGKAFTRELELVEPALARTAPVVLPVDSPRLARRVFVVIVDGLRSDRSHELPFLDQLRRQGLDLEAQSHYPTWSRPNYVSILAGVPPTASGVRTNYHFTSVSLDTLMDRAHDARLNVATATDYAVLPELFLRPIDPRDAARTASLESDLVIGPAIIPHAEGAMRSVFDDARYTPWPGGFTQAGSALVAGDADLVVLLLSPVDIAGHEHGADDPEYRFAAERADRALARVLGDVDLEHDTIVVVADHGHTGPGGHGGIEPEVMTVPLILAGAGVDRTGRAPDARLIDVAPTVAALLGIPAPGHGLGVTLTDLLALDADARAQRAAADRLRLSITQSVVALSEARAEVQLLEDRALRLALVGLGAGLAIALAVFALRRRALRLDLRVLLVSVPAFFGVYYTLIGTVGQRFSPSLVPEQGDIADSLIKYAALSMAVQLAASLWALNRQRPFAQRLAAANGIAWVCLMLTLIPAGLLWAYFPAPYVIVPGPFWLVVIPAVQIAVAAAAINVALTLVVEVVVFAAEAWQEHPPPAA
jgi:hypothetical protein